MNRSEALCGAAAEKILSPASVATLLFQPEKYHVDPANRRSLFEVIAYHQLELSLEQIDTLVDRWSRYAALCHPHLIPPDRDQLQRQVGEHYQLKQHHWPVIVWVALEREPQQLYRWTRYLPANPMDHTYSHPLSQLVSIPIPPEAEKSYRVAGEISAYLASLAVNHRLKRLGYEVAIRRHLCDKAAYYAEAETRWEIARPYLDGRIFPENPWKLVMDMFDQGIIPIGQSCLRPTGFLNRHQPIDYHHVLEYFLAFVPSDVPASSQDLK